MIYRAIGVMSGSSLDGLDLAMVEFDEQGGRWNYEIQETACYSFETSLREQLKAASSLNALEYELLNVSFGQYIGERVNQFIEEKKLNYKVSLVSSHGHTSFHVPAKKMTAQLGHGAAIAAVTRLPVVTELRALDVALGGQGAPIVPIGEKLLMPGYRYFLNIGGIANLSSNNEKGFIAFDICPANRVLNMLANEGGLEYDDGGQVAASGEVDSLLLEKLNSLEYYRQLYPKSLSNDFGTEEVYPMVREKGLSLNKALRTYTEHVAIQVQQAFSLGEVHSGKPAKMLLTGGGAYNKFLVSRITDLLAPLDIEVDVPGDDVISYKEAMIMAFIGVLRWRQETNVMASVTGAERDSVGGALWTGE